MPKLLISISIIAFTLGLATGCNSNDSSQELAYFPVQNAPQAQVLLTSMEGKLVLENGCLRVAHEFLFWQNYSVLVIWPFNYSWVSEGNAVWIFNEMGKKVAKVGDSVKCGGGNIPSNSVKVYTGQEPPTGIEGPFWLMGNIQSQ